MSTYYHISAVAVGAAVAGASVASVATDGPFSWHIPAAWGVVALLWCVGEIAAYRRKRARNGHFGYGLGAKGLALHMGLDRV